MITTSTEHILANFGQNMLLQALVVLYVLIWIPLAFSPFDRFAWMLENVLVVLFAIFTGRIGGFTKGVQETDTCAQKCTSLNSNPGSHPTQDTKSCIEGQYIAGTYIDGKYGCCCVSKS
mgnify:CR=1 FL=1